jgi:hypothetical protein
VEIVRLVKYMLQMSLLPLKDLEKVNGEDSERKEISLGNSS